ncbi:MAG: TetR/AcrR family transcriptional regulator [Candidatus Rokubacteria bacterium]|nr:TetR/AcrR family transcriptional regulator [Candidatus Rokubacteria bacterium]
MAGRLGGVAGAGKRAKARPNVTRERILAESARVFNRRGYDATTLDDIARALGVTKAALYYYVENKEDVLYQCHTKALDLATDAVQTALAQTPAPDEQLRIVFRRYIEGMTDQLAGAVVLLYEGALSPALNRRILDRRDAYERMLRGIVEDGIARGIFVPCDSKLVVFAILGALNWIPRWYDAAGPRAATDIATSFAEFFVRGLSTNPSSTTLLRP